MNPKGLFYSKEHQWMRVEGDEAVVGITDHAQQALGDITFVDLPKVGKVFKANDSMMVVESVKAASDVYAPVGGTVSAVNGQVSEKPELVNRSPYGDGWLCKLKPFDSAAVGRLMDAARYEAFLAES